MCVCIVSVQCFDVIRASQLGVVSTSGALFAGSKRSVVSKVAVTAKMNNGEENTPSREEGEEVEVSFDDLLTPCSLSKLKGNTQTKGCEKDSGGGVGFST